MTFEILEEKTLERLEDLVFSLTENMSCDDEKWCYSPNPTEKPPERIAQIEAIMELAHMVHPIPTEEEKRQTDEAFQRFRTQYLPRDAQSM